jgi:hypothetical protein
MSRSRTSRRINLLTTSSYVASSILAGKAPFNVKAFVPALALA